MAKNSMDSAEVYKLVNDMRIELKGDISAMGTNLATGIGRVASGLETAQKDINDLKIKDATQATKLAIIGLIASSIIGAVVSTAVGTFISGVVAK